MKSLFWTRRPNSCKHFSYAYYYMVFQFASIKESQRCGLSSEERSEELCSEERSEMGVESVVNFVGEKLKELWLAMENFWGQFLGWFDKIFPPETRGEKLHHWLHIAIPFAIAGVVLTLLLCCCYKCCCKRGGGGGRRGFKMMKAPGRNCRMPRDVFEANPKSYFRNLRAHPGDQLC